LSAVVEEDIALLWEGTPNEAEDWHDDEAAAKAKLGHELCKRAAPPSPAAAEEAGAEEAGVLRTKELDRVKPIPNKTADLVVFDSLFLLLEDNQLALLPLAAAAFLKRRDPCLVKTGRSAMRLLELFDLLRGMRLGLGETVPVVGVVAVDIFFVLVLKLFVCILSFSLKHSVSRSRTQPAWGELWGNDGYESYQVRFWFKHTGIASGRTCSTNDVYLFLVMKLIYFWFL